MFPCVVGKKPDELLKELFTPAGALFLKVP